MYAVRATVYKKGTLRFVMPVGFFFINSASQVTTSSKVRTAFNFIHIENYQIEFVCVFAKFPANQYQT